MMLAAAAASLALVTQDKLALRAAPKDNAAVQTLLWQGDVLEIRSRQQDYLQVYDHRHERAGYVRASAVQTSALTATEAPAYNTPELGYVEFAGWTLGNDRLLVAREARVEGKYQRSFELIRLDDLSTEKKADHPEDLSLFYRSQDVGWKKQTVSLR